MPRRSPSVASFSSSPVMHCRAGCMRDKAAARRAAHGAAAGLRAVRAPRHTLASALTLRRRARVVSPLQQGSAHAGEVRVKRRVQWGRRRGGMRGARGSPETQREQRVTRWVSQRRRRRGQRQPRAASAPWRASLDAGKHSSPCQRLGPVRRGAPQRRGAPAATPRARGGSGTRKSGARCPHGAATHQQGRPAPPRRLPPSRAWRCRRPCLICSAPPRCTRSQAALAAHDRYRASVNRVPNASYRFKGSEDCCWSTSPRHDRREPGMAFGALNNSSHLYQCMALRSLLKRASGECAVRSTPTAQAQVCINAERPQIVSHSYYRVSTTFTCASTPCSSTAARVWA